MILQREHIPQANAGASDLEGKRDKGNTMEPPPGDTFIQKDISIRGTQNLVPEKCGSHNLWALFCTKKRKTLSKSVHKSKLAQVTMSTAFTT